MTRFYVIWFIAAFAALGLIASPWPINLVFGIVMLGCVSMLTFGENWLDRG